MFIWHHATTNCGRGYFRDYLIKHRDEAQKYACLKRELAEKFADDREAYTNARVNTSKRSLNGRCVTPEQPNRRSERCPIGRYPFV